jgi:hypothetical protein
MTFSISAQVSSWDPHICLRCSQIYKLSAERTFSNLRWVSYFSRSLISRIYFPRTGISKKHFSWTVMRSLSPTHLCDTGTYLHRSTVMDISHETPQIWVISLWGMILWLVYFRSLHICKTIILMLSIR